MKINRIIFLVLILIIPLIFCSCNAEETVDAKVFPATPDKIVIGQDGVERELLPGSTEFDNIISALSERVEDSGRIDNVLLDAFDRESGEHMSFSLRKSETFIELIYNESNPQSFTMFGEGGATVFKKLELTRAFFPLTNTEHDMFFISTDAEYKDSATIGFLVDDTSLITTVRDLLKNTATNEQ